MASADSTPRVVQVIDHLGPGGAQRQFVELAIGLHRRNYPLLVCALDDQQHEFAEPLRTAGVEVCQIPQSGKLDLAAAKSLYSVLEEFNPDVVQSWLYTADMYARPVAKCLAKRRRRKLAVVSSVRSAETDKKAHYVWVDRALRGCTDAFIVNANILAETLVEREWVKRDSIHTIYNGIDFNYFDSAVATPSADNAFVVGYVGRLSPEKRPELFIQAAAQLYAECPEARFVMIGSGAAAEYQQLATDLGINNRLEIRGFSDDIAPLLKTFDLLISCSDYEGCSNTILEGMAAGVPVLATDVGGNRELIRDDGGWLVPAGDAGALGQQAVRVQRDESARRQVVGVARQRVQDEFSQDSMISRHESLYQNLLA